MFLLALPVLLALLVLPHPASAADRPGAGAAPGVAAEVTRLYAEAARATETYERGRRAAAAQRALAGRLQRDLVVKRRELARLNDRMGEVARAQYRSGGSLALTARLLLADDADDVMRAQQLAQKAERAVNGLMERTRGAERRLARAEGQARAAWRDLDLHGTRLAAIKRGIETRLEHAQVRLQAEADRSVAVGRCPWPVPARGPGGPAGAAGFRGGSVVFGRGWVAPVARYELSAGYARAGARWAHRHTGQDFAVDIGTPVRSIGAGRVHSVSCGGAFGIQVVVGHAGGWYSQYAHLAMPGVHTGERVAAGQWIGRSGSTGNSTGPHLHFEVRLTPYMGSAVDPVRWLREHGVLLRGAGGGSR
ncbi:M23 family metallopeptidase [Streptomyces ficellus]|uniref:M23 family metallopeptidase n=1 Tax=Streptomyces ficellus TaxID=1977088 RepID=A0ABT7ZE12_9ACTN|nr:M23 family metallopeptidase [Streptomyces ficellus]MDN3297756.1 M23 family metallopeptidase [Streptomyces ficellus]